MEPILKLKPAHKGLIVRDPITQAALPEDGVLKPVRGVDGRYWRRRLNDGSVIVVDETIKEKPSKTTKTKKIKFGGKIL